MQFSNKKNTSVTRQRQKNLGSRVAMLPGKFLRVRKVFARIIEKNLLNCLNTFKTIQIFPDDCQFSGLFQNCPDFSRWMPIFQIISKWSGFSQLIANFPDYFKTVWIFPDECQFYGWFQNCRIFPDDFQFSGWFQNCPDFSRWMPTFRIISKVSWLSRWLPIFRIISKLSGFFQLIANFPDSFKTVRIFPDDCQFSGWFQNCPDFSRWLPIFWMISKVFGFFQMQMVTPDAANFVWQTNFCYGGREYPKFRQKNCAKNRYFWSRNPFFIYFSPFWFIL